MHQTEHGRFQHSHDFMHDFSRAERRTRVVIGITVAMMLLEITAGIFSHSMALLADGWHMSTHVIAFVMAAIAYRFTRRHADDRRFSFGTGKIGVLGGYSSAIVLSIIALAMAGESIRPALLAPNHSFQRSDRDRRPRALRESRLRFPAQG